MFWLCIAEVVYAFVGYPVVLVLITGLHHVWQDIHYAVHRRDRRSAREAVPVPPSVSVVFAAHNEAAVIGEKIRNCAALEYPEGLLDVVVGCDACSDGTPDLLRASGMTNLRVEDYRERTGKPGVLNRLVPSAHGEIVVFSDANTMLDSGAVQRLVRHFQNPKVGCVCGELRFLTRAGAVKSEGAYWRYEQILKIFESRLNMLVGANGGIFAIRRELFDSLPRFAIIDDFLIAMQIRARGFWVIYDPEAVATEETGADARQEFQRRLRIGAGAYHALRYTWRMLLPSAGSVCFSYWSHKVFRWLAPFALAGAALAAVALSATWFYAVCALAAAASIAAALYGYLQEVRGHRIGWVFAVSYYFLSMNLALMFGLFRFLAGTQTSVWRRTARH